MIGNRRRFWLGSMSGSWSGFGLGLDLVGLCLGLVLGLGLDLDHAVVLNDTVVPNTK